MKWLINCLRCGHSWNVETQYGEKGLPPAQSAKCPNCRDDTFMYKKCELLNESAQKQVKERTATSIPSTHSLTAVQEKVKSRDKMSFLDKLFGKKKSAPSNINLKQTSNEPTSKNSVGSLVAELIQIGIRTKRYVPEYEDYIYYFPPKGEGIGPDKEWDARTREIGEELYRLGEAKIQFMQNGHSSVIKILGPLAGRYLEAVWHEIGFEQFRQGKGEVWLS